MAVPKWRHTKSKRNKRRMHIFLVKPTLTKCSKCGHSILPHIVCPNCGYYKGVEVINVLEKLTKKEKKKREKEMKTQGTESSSAKATEDKGKKVEEGEVVN